MSRQRDSTIYIPLTIPDDYHPSKWGEIVRRNNSPFLNLQSCGERQHRPRCLRLSLRYAEGMQLSPEAIDEFKAIYKKEYGEDISDDEARDMGTRFLRVLKVIQDVCGREVHQE